MHDSSAFPDLMIMIQEAATFFRPVLKITMNDSSNDCRDIKSQKKKEINNKEVILDWPICFWIQNLVLDRTKDVYTNHARAKKQNF